MNQQNWKKPRGVLRALNAFDGSGSGRSKPRTSGAITPGSRMKKTGTVIKAVNNLSSSSTFRPRPAVKQPQNNTKLFRRSGTVIKAVNAIGGARDTGGNHTSDGSASVSQMTINQSRSITPGMASNNFLVL